MLDKNYKVLRDLILKNSDNIKGVHKMIAPVHLNSKDNNEQLLYLNTVIDQTNDDFKTASDIWGKEAVDFIEQNFNRNQNNENMKLKKILEDLANEAKDKPSKGLTKKKKSAVVKAAKAGKDIGKKGKGFKKVAAKAAEKYGSKEIGQKVAAAAMWKNLKEGEDHEVAMAISSLKSIADSILKLKEKLGTSERNIPGWIQDHISKAENYIEQAAQGFHELNN